ncbi:hypothetical protein LOD99_3568 [Oopsacas minuta]|uniref:Uncharacterized protein n=1 Tax=Oopsacas minuta TaxID=111878 RepID=A0AAV7JXA7_9METZ|nr:hypothetical protein LOD99_3568 [Oopsacas minuta]
MFLRGLCLLFILFIQVSAVTDVPTSSRVLIDTATELHGQFIALYILFPICLIECCICLPVVLGLMLGICATVPGCRIHKSLTKKVREEYILEQEAQMPQASIFPPTTIYPGNMPMKLPPYEAYAQ